MIIRISSLLAVVMLLMLGGCASQGASRAALLRQADGQVGMASYYSDRYQGRRTASGEDFDQRASTAAHRSLPFDAKVKVTRLDNGRRTWVRINDRGPHVRGRIIDVSRKAARELDMLRDGTARVQIDVVD